MTRKEIADEALIILLGKILAEMETIRKELQASTKYTTK